MFYVFHGDDEHTLRETLAGLLDRLGDPALRDLNTLRFDGPGVAFSELREACDSVPFLTEARVIIVNNLLASEPSYLDDLLAYLPVLPESTRLVFVETRPLPANHPMLALAEASPNGYEKAFSRPEGADLARWIRLRVTSHGGKISPRAAYLLASNVGNNLTLLENEIEKLTLYKGQQIIEVDDIALLCSQVAEASIFEFVDALGNRNGRAAAQLLQEKLSEGTDPFYLFAMIVRQFRLLIQVKELADDGRRPPDVARKLKLHSFVSGKLYQQCHNFDQAQLEQIYSHLLEVDVGVKTGRIEMTTALDLLLAGLSL